MLDIGVERPRPSVIVADDSTLFREGLARLLTEHGFEATPKPRTPKHSWSSWGASRRTWSSPTSVCYPPETTRGRLQRNGHVENTPEVGVLVLSQRVETTHAMKLLKETPEAVGYLLKDRVFGRDGL
jgi:DNA-binding NarL/FixJ family response regulator